MDQRYLTVRNGSQNLNNNGQDQSGSSSSGVTDASTSSSSDYSPIKRPYNQADYANSGNKVLDYSPGKMNTASYVAPNQQYPKIPNAYGNQVSQNNVQNESRPQANNFYIPHSRTRHQVIMDRTTPDAPYAYQNGNSSNQHNGQYTQPAQIPNLQQQRIPQNVHIQNAVYEQNGPAMQQGRRYPQPNPPSPYQLNQPSAYAPTPQNMQYAPQQQYPQMNQQYNGTSNNPQMQSMMSQMGNLSVTQAGFNQMRGADSIDLLRIRDVIPSEKLAPARVYLHPNMGENENCDPNLLRCTLNRIPDSKSLLDKSRLPFGVMLHPFRDVDNLPVITTGTIVRCARCRVYINPFVFITDGKHWKCNLCYKVNEFSNEFLCNNYAKSIADRAEIQNSTVEFIAPAEYMVRPPQPAIYVFVMDVSRIAAQSGYLQVACDCLVSRLDKLPGDARASIAFITYDSSVHFYSISEGLGQPRQLIITDIDDVFVPSPEDIIINLHEHFDMIKELLTKLPKKYSDSYDTNSAMGAALQAAYKLLTSSGGRVTMFQCCLPNFGPGALTARENPNQRMGEKVQHLTPAMDYYKKLGLDCCTQQIGVDIFLLNSQYADLATFGGISQVTAGCVYHFPLFSAENPLDVDKFKVEFERYLTRKIGFEAVLRLRCNKGLSIHSFHGHFFVRTSDLLAVPVINPDMGFAVQVTIDENLSHLETVCFQAALLYTSSQGERRIRVHTLCLPVTSNIQDLFLGADQESITGLLAKMAVDRSIQSSISDAREAFMNAICDVLTAYKTFSSFQTGVGSLLASHTISRIPLYILAMLKFAAFRISPATRLDDRVYAMMQMKCTPLDRLIQLFYPDLYPLHNITQYPEEQLEDGTTVHMPPILQLTAEKVDSTGVYLMDAGDVIYIFVCHNAPPHICKQLLGYDGFNLIPENLVHFPETDGPENIAVRKFVNTIQAQKFSPVAVLFMKDIGAFRLKFYEKLIEDKTESGVSYYEFLQSVRRQMSS